MSDMDTDSDYRDSGSGASDDSSGSEGERIYDEFLGQVRTWLKANGDRVKAAYDSDGGWEQWLQIELYFQLTGNTDLQVEREPSSYPGQAAGLKGDLLLNKTVTVELKAETLSEKADAFVNKLSKDLDKVENLKKGAALVIGFSRSAEARDLIQGYNLGDTELVGGTRITYSYTSG